MTSNNGLPNFFLAGCQKTASTWLHRCFQEHPQIYVPKEDATHYFTINYFRGIDWYAEFYKDYSGEPLVGDTTPSYIRDHDAPARIFEFNKDSKIIFSLRNPVKRAFSHYWHEKGKGKIKYEFSEVLENYDLYQNYIVSGFYRQHLERYYNYFPKEQILILIFEELDNNPELFIRKIFEFLNVDAHFKPSILNKVINPAAIKIKKPGNNNQHQNKKMHKLMKYIKDPENKSFHIKLIRLLLKIKWKIRKLIFMDRKSEYEKGIDMKLVNNLEEIFKEENEKLKKITNINLSYWSN